MEAIEADGYRFVDWGGENGADCCCASGEEAGSVKRAARLVIRNSWGEPKEGCG